jgi:hypothetical protein
MVKYQHSSSAFIRKEISLGAIRIVDIPFFLFLVVLCPQYHLAKKDNENNPAIIHATIFKQEDKARKV